MRTSLKPPPPSSWCPPQTAVVSHKSRTTPKVPPPPSWAMAAPPQTAVVNHQSRTTPKVPPPPSWAMVVPKLRWSATSQEQRPRSRRGVKYPTPGDRVRFSCRVSPARVNWVIFYTYGPSGLSHILHTTFYRFFFDNCNSLLIHSFIHDDTVYSIISPFTIMPLVLLFCILCLPNTEGK